MPVKVQQLASKKSAMASARAKTESKSVQKRKTVQSKPASKKATPKKKGATVAPKKKVTALAVDPKRQAKAIEIDGRMASAVKSMISGSEEVVEIASEMEKGGHWKDLPEKYTSFTAWMNKYAEQAHVSIRTLKGGISFAKATPQLSAAERKNIGPRKGAKITAAAKAAEAKGQTLDPEILEKAAERTEEEVRADLVERGLIIETQKDGAEEHDANFDENREVLSGSASAQFYSVPAEGDYGAQSAVPDHGPFEDVPHATPEPEADEMEENPAVVIAVATARIIFSEGLGDSVVEDVLSFIVRQWLRSPCTREDLQDMTNEQAAEHLIPKKGNGKRKKGDK